jgi:hypothetical protein
MNNLREIDGKKQMWAMDTGHTNGTVMTPAEVDKYVLGDRIRCPSGGTYTVGAIGEAPTCSLATNPAPVAVKERVGLLGWRWKIWPSTPATHKLP